MKKYLLITSFLLAAIGFHLLTIPKDAKAEIKVEGDPQAIRSLVVEGYSQSPSKVVLQGTPEEIRGLFYGVGPSFGSGMSQPIVGAGTFTSATSTDTFNVTGTLAVNTTTSQSIGSLVAGGNVFIGGASAGATGGLTVQGQTTTTALIIGNTNPTINMASGDLLFTRATGTSLYVDSLNLGTISITNATANNTIEVDQNGNVGTDVSVDGAIHVENTGNTDIGLGVYSNIGATAAAPLVVFKAANTAFDQPTMVIEHNNTSATSSLVVWGNERIDGNATTTGNLTVDAPTLIVQADTNRVGIGTASPASQLQLSGGELSIVGTNSQLTNQSGLMLWGGTNGGTLYGRGNVSGGDDDLIIKFVDELEFQDSGGNVLFKMSDNGTTGNATSTGKMAMTGLETNITANGVGITTNGQLQNCGAAACIPSALRFKDNISPLNESASDLLSKLEVKNYELKNKPGDPRVGLIAEDVERLNPDLVGYDPDGNVLTLHFEDFASGWLVKGWQELKASIDRLFTNDSKQDETIRALTERIERLEEKLEVRNYCSAL